MPAGAAAGDRSLVRLGGFVAAAGTAGFEEVLPARLLWLLGLGCIGF